MELLGVGVPFVEMFPANADVANEKISARLRTEKNVVVFMMFVFFGLVVFLFLD